MIYVVLAFCREACWLINAGTAIRAPSFSTGRVRSYVLYIGMIQYHEILSRIRCCYQAACTKKAVDIDVDHDRSKIILLLAWMPAALQQSPRVIFLQITPQKPNYTENPRIHLPYQAWEG